MQINMSEAVEDLLTIGDFLRWAVSSLEQSKAYLGHGTDNSWDEALTLILPSLYLPLDIEPQLLNTHLTRSERKHLAMQVKRRVEDHIPSPYLTNKAWFGGLEFFVDERVLIPRSPFAEVLQDVLPNWFGEEGPGSILELCTGSGCIAVLAALTYPDANMTATDISSDALLVAQKNRAMHDLDDSLQLLQSDVFDTVPGATFDLIISNPPYVGAAELGSIPKEYQHEPTLALAAGEDGLDIVVRILAQAESYLTENGMLVVEVGNSDEALQQRYPGVPFLWLEFERGGHGVFALSAKQLREYRSHFVLQG